MLELRRATLRDIPKMQNLVSKEIESGVILKRSDDEVATNIRSYLLGFSDGELVGYGALHIHSPTLAEIRSLVTKENFRGKGVAKNIINNLLKEAQDLGVKRVLVLTYLPEVFMKLGFVEIPKETIPEHKIWADCIKCIHFPLCKETSLIYDLTQES
jgi:amino-acid N-acetyltransferase